MEDVDFEKKNKNGFLNFIKSIKPYVLGALFIALPMLIYTIFTGIALNSRSSVYAKNVSEDEHKFNRADEIPGLTEYGESTVEVYLSDSSPIKAHFTKVPGETELYYHVQLTNERKLMGLVAKIYTATSPG